MKWSYLPLKGKNLVWICVLFVKKIRTKKSTSMPHERSRLVEASKQLNDDLLEDIENENIDCIR